MVTLTFEDKNLVENFKLAQGMRNMGIPEDIIQTSYNNTVEKQKNDDVLMRKE